MRIFDYIDYKEFTKDWLKSRPKGGRGEWTRLAQVAQTHKAAISQVFRGDKNLSPEQALRVARHLELRTKEARYYVLLNDYARAGSADLRDLYKELIEREQESQQELAQRLPRARELSGEEKAIFYSNWIYSAVRVLTSIPGFQNSTDIAKRLKIPKSSVDSVCEFLLQTGLCIENAGRLAPGAQSTFLEAKSPLISRHHGNWRVKAMEKHPLINPREEICYSAPMSLSSSDVKKIREILAKTIENADEVVGPSACEKLFCLNIDWFEVV